VLCLRLRNLKEKSGKPEKEGKLYDFLEKTGYLQGSSSKFEKK
jgi:hypothetical protein